MTSDKILWKDLKFYWIIKHYNNIKDKIINIFIFIFIVLLLFILSKEKTENLFYELNFNH